MTLTTKHLLLFGCTALFGITACSKKFSQMDLDNARNEGMASTAPNAAQKTLTTAIRNFNVLSIQLQKVQDSLKGAGYYPGNKNFSEASQGKIISALTPILRKAIATLGTVKKSATHSSIKIFADGTENASQNGSNGKSTGTAAILIGFKDKGAGNQTFTLPDNAGTIILKNSATATGIPNFTWLYPIEVAINSTDGTEEKIGAITNLPTFSLLLSEALQQLKERADAAR